MKTEFVPDIPLIDCNEHEADLSRRAELENRRVHPGRGTQKKDKKLISRCPCRITDGPQRGILFNRFYFNVTFIILQTRPRIFSVKLIAHTNHPYTHLYTVDTRKGGREGRAIRFNRQFSFQPFSTDDFDRSAIYPWKIPPRQRERETEGEREGDGTSVRGRVVPYANSFYCRGTESRPETWTRVNGRPSSLPALISFMPSAPARLCAPSPL